jgi:DNA-binding PadR family transcriptional regulator
MYNEHSRHHHNPDAPDHHGPDASDHHGGHGRGFGGSRMPGFGFGPGGPGFGGFGPRGFMPPGPPRKRRGDVRVAILSLLSEQSFNGYGLIKEIGERSGGTWHPSPGSVYPTLQQLVDEELIESSGEGKRTEFQLTDAGRTWVGEHSEELARVWESSEARLQADAGLHESITKLMGVVHQFRFAATDEQRAKAVQQLDDTRRALYGILAD